MPRITKNNPLTNYISREEIARIHHSIETSVAEQHKAEVARRNRNTPTALLGVLQPDSEEYTLCTVGSKKGHKTYDLLQDVQTLMHKL